MPRLRPDSIARRALAALAFVSVAACNGKSDATPTAPAEITGTYALTSLDGQPLPATIAQNSQFVTQAKSGQITLDANQTFAIGFVVTANGRDSTIAATGTYVRTGSDLAFTSTVDGLTGTLPGSIPSAGAVNLTVYFAGGTHASTFRK